jgi:hypothetical protein
MMAYSQRNFHVVTTTYPPGFNTQCIYLGAGIAQREYGKTHYHGVKRGVLKAW